MAPFYSKIVFAETEDAKIFLVLQTLGSASLSLHPIGQSKGLALILSCGVEKYLMRNSDLMATRGSSSRCTSALPSCLLPTVMQSILAPRSSSRALVTVLSDKANQGVTDSLFFNPYRLNSFSPWQREQWSLYLAACWKGKLLEHSVTHVIGKSI